MRKHKYLIKTYLKILYMGTLHFYIIQCVVAFKNNKILYDHTFYVPTYLTELNITIPLSR